MATNPTTPPLSLIGKGEYQMFRRPRTRLLVKAMAILPSPYLHAIMITNYGPIKQSPTSLPDILVSGSCISHHLLALWLTLTKLLMSILSVLCNIMLGAYIEVHHYIVDRASEVIYLSLTARYCSGITSSVIILKFFSELFLC